MTIKRPEPILFLSDTRGIYIPRDFANEVIRDCVAGVSEDDWAILENPDHEAYWDVWNDVEREAKITDPITHVVYGLYQNGDCWLIPDGMRYSEHDEGFYWPCALCDNEALPDDELCDDCRETQNEGAIRDGGKD